MSSARNQTSTFPAVPPSLSAGDYGMRDYYTEQDTQRPVPHTLSTITPYLGLRARLSQVWVNRWTILILLVLVRALIAIGSLNSDIASARKEALSACTGVEAAGSALASMPHYLSAGVNELAADGITKVVNGLMNMLTLTITGVEEIVVFYINLLTSTYVCLITLAVSGSLHVAIQVAEDVTAFLNKTLADIGDDLQQGIDGFQTDLNKFTSTLSSIPLVGGKISDIPKLNIDSQLAELDNVHLPSSLDEGLNTLNASIPTFAQVQNFTNNAIRLPFELVKTLINNSLPHYQMNGSIFPVPAKKQLTFCSDNNGINSFFDDLLDIAIIARKIFIGVLLIAAVLACIPMAYRDIRGWRTMKKRSLLIREKAQDPMDVVYIASRPYTSAAGLKIADNFVSTKKKLLTRWFVAYITSPPALFLLSLGMAGLFSCLCQYMLLRAVQKEVPVLVTEVADFTGAVVDSLNNASEQWSIGTNQVISDFNNDINKDVFGWVNISTTALNDTLNTFVDDMTNALNETFGGTVLYQPILGVFECLIGLKIAGIEKALTWVSDNAHVDFPELPNNTFSLGAAASLAEGGNSSAEALLTSPTSTTTDDITAAVNVVTEHLLNGIETETLISLTILALWAILVIFGLVRALWLLAKHDKVRGVGGATYAGDIPLEPTPARPSVRSVILAQSTGATRPVTPAMSIVTPAPPIYEPPQQGTRHYEHYQRSSLAKETRDAFSPVSDEEFENHKLGIAGQRGPGMRGQVGGRVRASEYGNVVGQKNPFGDGPFGDGPFGDEKEMRY
ncbi:MAG: plasma membrane fusion protein prm1 [Icmadophila ericetorum]|nr:plasma membrane fusion protein prm1 [Icmadophila ericetorum]